MMFGLNGRYNELVNGGYFMVYKPTSITAGPHSVLDDHGYYVAIPYNLMLFSVLLTSVGLCIF